MQTLLIVRPRALVWDLLLVEGVAGTVFRQMSRVQAQIAAQGFYDALQEWFRGGPGHVGLTASMTGYLIWADIGEYCLVACERVPGQPYRPMVFAREEEAQRAVARIAAILHPPADAIQEVYFNTHHFKR
jgi:hypothetical protein